MTLEHLGKRHSKVCFLVPDASSCSIFTCKCHWHFAKLHFYFFCSAHTGRPWRGGSLHSPVHTAVLLHERFSRRGPTHWVVKEVVAQRRVRLCQPSPQLTEHELQVDHSSALASRRSTNHRFSSHFSFVRILVEEYFPRHPPHQFGLQQRRS